MSALTAPDIYGHRWSADRTILVDACYEPSTANGKPGKPIYYVVTDMITKTAATRHTLGAARSHVDKILLNRVSAGWRDWVRSTGVWTARTVDLACQVQVQPATEHPGMWSVSIQIDGQVGRGWLVELRTAAQARAYATAWADALISGKAPL